MATQVITVPDIGADSADLIELLVEVGEQVELDQSLVALESDKASLEVPSPVAGKIIALNVAVGDKLSEGMNLLEIEVESVEEESVEKESIALASVEEPSENSSTEVVTESVESEKLFQVPDIGADEAEIIEVSVAVGDLIEEGDTIVVLETDKASVDVPAEASGTVVAIPVSEGGKIKQGDDLVSLMVASTTIPETVKPTEVPAAPETVKPTEVHAATSEPESKVSLVPDMGSDSAQVIELSVAVGDRVEEGDTIVVAETDKASVDVPAEFAGEIADIHVAVDSSISQGDKLVTIMADAQAAPASAEPLKTEVASASSEEDKTAPSQVSAPVISVSASAEVAQAQTNSADIHAGPSVRKLARQLGVNLALVKPTGQRNRIIKEDIHLFVKQRMSSSAGSSSGGAGIPEIPAVDWTQFGETDIQPMSRIGKVTATNMVRNWLNVPHVTHFDSADVTELEKYRGYLKSESVSRGVKMTPLAFLLRAVTVALQENPKFNTALQGDDLVERKYFHLSIAVDTPLGLMVPVIRNVDQKDIWQLASEVSSLAAKAKNGKLSPKEMQGASFTISSLGAIGGTGFTPIVPAPQVGILGVSKTSIQPVWDGTSFVPRNMMPLALSYDHRVVNGADAGKFMTCLVSVLSDLNRIWNG